MPARLSREVMGISVTSLMFVEAILDLISTGTMRLDPSDKLED